MVDRLASMLVLACVLCSSLCAAADEGAKLPLGQDPRWSPDSRLVAASHRGFETLGLVVWEPATERVRSFALPSIPVRPPVWLSSDRVATMSHAADGQEPQRTHAVYVADLTDGSVRRTAGAGEHGISQMAASPDGTRMVLSGSKFVHDAEKVIMPDGRTAAQWGAKTVGGDSGLWLLDVEAAVSTPLAQEDGASDISPTFSPDGTRVLFTRMTEVVLAEQPPPKRNVAAIDLQTGEVTLLTTDDVSHMGSWSPDGGRIAYFRVGQEPELWVMDADGGNARALKQGPIACPYPGAPAWWRPDGKYLAYESDGQLFAVPTEGVGLQRISGDLKLEHRHGFAISPDGKSVAYGVAKDHESVIEIAELQWPDEG